ncbi:hypothetical protein [Streptomyces scabiei]|uniref:hypothetical protein n=2 Tax=Streptomyces scabiei TaxID=1930 RepID=UPI00131D7245|nr:hypothetical protein [Streptomyces scabiei]
MPRPVVWALGEYLPARTNTAPHSGPEYGPLLLSRTERGLDRVAIPKLLRNVAATHPYLAEIPHPVAGRRGALAGPVRRGDRRGCRGQQGRAVTLSRAIPFTGGGPAVTGEWENDDSVARRTNGTCTDPANGGLTQSEAGLSLSEDPHEHLDQLSRALEAAWRQMADLLAEAGDEAKVEIVVPGGGGRAKVSVDRPAGRAGPAGSAVRGRFLDRLPGQAGSSTSPTGPPHGRAARLSGGAAGRRELQHRPALDHRCQRQGADLLPAVPRRPRASGHGPPLARGR